MVDTQQSKLRLPPVVFRADADARIGTGHLMRCLALGQAWQDDGGEVHFVTACPSERLLKLLRGESFIVHPLEYNYSCPLDWRTTEQVLAGNSDSWLALDGYHFDSAYQQRAKDAGFPLLVMDDLAALPHYYADIVLNQNIQANSSDYHCESYTKLLLGPKYVLLRREFLQWRDWQRTIPEVARKVLVTLGGGDPENVTLKIIAALQQTDVKELEATVVVGDTNPHLDDLRSIVSESRVPITLLSQVGNMPEVIASTDVAIAAGGTTSWELAFLGTPRLVLVLASNQAPIASGLEISGAAVNLGLHVSVSTAQIASELTRLLEHANLRKEMSERARALVDGEGRDRVIMHLKGHKLRLRPARDSDSHLLWEWSNDDEVRASAFSRDPIGWEEHQQWVARKLEDADRRTFIGLDADDHPVGQVRFDLNPDGETEVDISVSRSWRRRGYGTEILRLACAKVLRVTPKARIVAHIKAENVSSIRTFEKAGFAFRSKGDLHGHDVITLSLR